MIRSILAMAVALTVSSEALAQQTGKPSQPNILFLFSDDQRADTIAALGNPHIITPNLDALAKRGTAFSNAYCLGANVGAVCTPSRNMLMCGQSFFHYGKAAAPDRPNLPTSLKQAGYVTYHHGKRGNTAAAIQALFDHNHYVNEGATRKSGEPGKVIVDHAIDFLKGEKSGKPFFMYLAFGTPHDPRVASERLMKRYDRDQLPLPKNYLPFHPFDNGDLKVRDEGLAKWPRTEAEIKRHLHDYYAVITGIDEQIGRLIAHLKSAGQLGNTIVIFSSDHGLAIGSHGLMGKQSLYEHSMKAPLVVAGPGIPAGKSDAFAYLLDLYPTICDLAGAEIPKGLDGKSLLPVIQGRQPAVRDAVFLAYRDVQRAVRQGNWKLLRFPQINHTLLFNLASDPDEMKNLADDPAHAGKVKELLELLAKQQQVYGDKLPLTVANPRPAKIDLGFFK